MTAPVVYDSNFSIQFVDTSHKHRIDSSGDEVVCAICGKTLVILCPDGHEGALERIRYSNGLKAAKPKRVCACGNELTGKAKQCADCRAEALVRRCPCGNELRKRAHFCDDCKAKRAEAMARRSCGCGKILEKGERKCTECKKKRRTPPPRRSTCNEPGCNAPVMAYSGRGRPPTRCEKHWNPVWKRGKS